MQLPKGDEWFRGVDGTFMPRNWKLHIRRERTAPKPRNGINARRHYSKPDLVACEILAEIMDRAPTQQLFTRAFFEELTGESKQTVSERLRRLVELGLINIEYRTISSSRGPLPNRMFITPMYDRVQEITHSTPDTADNESLK